MSSTADNRRGVPTWLAGVIIVLAVAGGAYLAYWFIWERSSLEADSVAVDPPRWARPRPQPEPRAEYPQGVRRARNGQDIICRNGHAIVRAVPTPGGEFDITLTYIVGVRERWVGKEQGKIADIGLRALGTPALAAHIALTPEQQRRIEALPSRVTLAPREIAELQPLFKAWAAAKDSMARARAADALMSTCGRIGGARIAEAEQLLIERARRIGQILTKDQIDRARTWAGAVDATAAG